MRILLDENVPVDIIPVLLAAGHHPESVNFLGWKGLKNGEVLARAEAGFDLFLTRDKDFDADYLTSDFTRRFGVVLLTIPQQLGPDYPVAFAASWPADPRDLIGRVTRLGP